MEPADSDATYPACRVIARTVQVGGQTKAQLLECLGRSGVRMNALAEVLFASDKFVTSDVRTQMTTVELSVRNLGVPHGATILDLHASATRLGLQLCPVELGPHLRLQFLDQPEGSLGQPVWQHRAPPGSVTVASEMLLADDDEFPKGFYLRRIEGTLWLRGYQCAREHIWQPEDRLLFTSPSDDAGRPGVTGS